MPNFDPMPTLALILAPQSGPAHLDATLGDPFLRSIFQGALNVRALNYKISFIDITVHLSSDARTTYTLDPDITGSLFSVFKKLIQVITCTGNNFNPNVDIMPLPSNLPNDAITSLNMPDPVVSWGTLTASINPLSLEFYSVGNIFKMFHKLQDIANFLFGWIAEAIKTSVLQGESSKWNFRSYFGLTFKEFLDRIRPVVQGNPYWNILPGFVQNYNTTTAKKGVLIHSMHYFLISTHHSSKTSNLLLTALLTSLTRNEFAPHALVYFTGQNLTFPSRSST